jgi:hypothetical protein
MFKCFRTEREIKRRMQMIVSKFSLSYVQRYFFFCEIEQILDNGNVLTACGSLRIIDRSTFRLGDIIIA